jgi:hypothetical protein
VHADPQLSAAELEAVSEEGRSLVAFLRPQSEASSAAAVRISVG